MSQGDSAAVYIQLVKVKAQVMSNSYRLGGKGFIRLNQIKIADLHACLIQNLLGGGHRPIPMMEGSTPASSPAIQVAMGVMPSSFALSSLMTMMAAAPSLIPEALPAVTIPPSFLKAGFNLARPSLVTPFLGPSSVSTMTDPFLVFTSTGTISSLKRPSFMAASHFCWLFAANSSSCSLVRAPLFTDVFCGHAHVVAVEGIGEGILQ